MTNDSAARRPVAGAAPLWNVISVALPVAAIVLGILLVAAATTSIPIAMMANAAPVGVDATSLFLKTAESLGLTVPPSMLLRADQVIK